MREAKGNRERAKIISEDLRVSILFMKSQRNACLIQVYLFDFIIVIFFIKYNRENKKSL